MINHNADRQFECLALIRTACRTGQPPTRSELGAALGITKVSAHLLVNKLREKGYVAITHTGWRNVEPTQSGWRVTQSAFTVGTLRGRDH